MSAQVDHDLLADYIGGALDGTPDADRVAGLIAGSPQWRAAADELTSALSAVSADLEALRGTPEIMPPEIVARFDDLLRSPTFTPPVARPPVDPLAARQPTRKAKPARNWRRWAVPAGLAVAFFGFLTVLNLFPTPSQEGKPASAPREAGTADLQDASTQPVPTFTSGKHHNRSSLGTTRVAAESVPPQPTAKAPETMQSLGIDMFGTPPELLRLTDPVALRRCLDAIALVLPGTATLAEYAYFEGRPALVIPITSGEAKWMFVAGPACGINGPDEIYRKQLQ